MLTRILLFICTLSLAAFAQTPPIEPGVSQDLAKWRAAHYSDVRYKLNLTLEKMSPVLKGTMEIRVKVSSISAPGGMTPSKTVTRPSGEVAVSQGSEPGAIATGFLPTNNSTPIILDWRKIRGSENLSTISNVTLNGGAKNPVAIAPGSDKTAARTYEESNEHLIFREGVVPGENVIKLDFTSPILTSGSAITRYVDKEDGAEYIYSLFVPSDASTAFPVFDQPDLKARFELTVKTPKEWKVISNSLGEGSETSFGDGTPREFKSSFVETRPISTYVFAFAAGPFERFWIPDEPKPPISAKQKEVFKKWLTNDVSVWVSPEQAERMRKEKIERLSKGYASDSRFFQNIYVRKSQAAKFKPHAAEVFRLNREGIKYLETYFDYKFPFPKLDLVLIPEFPFGGMEHAGAIFLRETSVIFPQEPTKNDYISRANLMFHEAAHQWFGDTVTMKWFDDLWLKEGFAEFMAYKTLEKVQGGNPTGREGAPSVKDAGQMPEVNAWKVFYERNKQAAYLTDSTKGTTPIYQEIANLNSAKSAYGNIVYRKAPSFLRQAEFYLGEDKFQTAVRAFLKKHDFANAGWEDLVKEFEAASGKDLKEWATGWVKQRGMPVVRSEEIDQQALTEDGRDVYFTGVSFRPKNVLGEKEYWLMKSKVLLRFMGGRSETRILDFDKYGAVSPADLRKLKFVFPNYEDYGYGIFLLDGKSRDYVLKNIQNEKDDFLRTMMWGSLWDSVREAELDPKDYVELVIKVLSSNFSWPDAAKKPAKAGTQNGETDESTIATLLNRVSTAMRYYMPGDAERVSSPHDSKGAVSLSTGTAPSLTVGLQTRLEALLIDRMQHASTPGQRITYYRAFLGLASSENARNALKQILAGPLKGNPKITPIAPLANDGLPNLRTKDKFDIVTRLMVLGDPDAPKLLAELEKTETSDDAKRYAYAARAGMATAENKAKYWSDFTTNKEISESWIEAAFVPFNSTRHADLTLPYLERALAELPNLKRSRKIFFVNGWLGAFIGGQRSEAALAIINKFLADNPNLDKDLRLKILENSDLIERAVKIREKYKNL